jgi:hypothetical protein
MIESVSNSYRVYHIDAAGRRVEHRDFTASDDADACLRVLAMQEKDGWPTIEVWANQRQVTCEAALTDNPCATEATTPDATWGRQIEHALGYLPRAKQLRAEAAQMRNPQTKQAMLRIADNYEMLAIRVSKFQSEL